MRKVSKPSLSKDIALFAWGRLPTKILLPTLLYSWDYRMNHFVQSFGGRDEIESCYIAKAGLGLTILLPLPPEYWDYRYNFK
jgi:hypothetical protein